MRLTYLDLGPRVRFRTSGIVDPSNSEMASPTHRLHVERAKLPRRAP